MKASETTTCPTCNRDHLVGEPCPSYAEALENVERAARELCALIGGNVGQWKLDGRKVTDDAGMALISLSAYLNDVSACR